MQGKTKFVLVLIMGILLIFKSSFATAQVPSLRDKLKPLVRQGCVLVADEQKVLFRYPRGCNPLLIPASLVKLATASMAFSVLGKEFRFPTEFFLSDKGSLLIRGHGDPFLVSEEWQSISERISEHPEVPKTLKGLIFDESLFGDVSNLPGQGRSLNPYDAPNGALVSNFNTVFIHKHQNGKVQSAEPQTPLTPSAVEWSRKLKPGKHRIRIPEGSRNSLRYTTELFSTFLEEKGMRLLSKKPDSRKVKASDRLLFVHYNQRKLDEVVEGMMAYSNNFIANQLLLYGGMKIDGPPAVPKKGLKVLKHHLTQDLGIPEEEFFLEEGSGLSRKNRMTPEAIWKVRVD
jgi:D-alanyl-D-alanine carboxypeptidase/D-alanyl-D-alanine-endopeptidase (penicillin-binding protein 4)